MYVATVPNRNSPPAILLRESFRLNGEVLNRTLANISHWPPAKIDALRSVLKGATSVGAPLPLCSCGRCPRHLAPFAARPPHRQTFQPPTRFGCGYDRFPRSGTCFQTRHLPCPPPRYPQQHALRTPPSRCPFRG